MKKWVILSANEGPWATRRAYMTRNLSFGRSPTDSRYSIHGRHQSPSSHVREDALKPPQMLFPRNVWIPHSLLSKPVHRPARSFSPALVKRVHGQQPMLR